MLYKLADRTSGNKQEVVAAFTRGEAKTRLGYASLAWLRREENASRS
jgi:hypothetical protein